MCLCTWGRSVYNCGPATHARLCRPSFSSSAGIWHCIKVGERDELQVLNWISWWISGTSLKCMWASPNDALIFALQRHQAYVSVVCLHVFLDQLAQADWWHITVMFALSVENCFVMLCMESSSDSVYIVTGNISYSNIQQTLCLWNIFLFCFYSECLRYKNFHELELHKNWNKWINLWKCTLAHKSTFNFCLPPFLPSSLPSWSDVVGPGSLVYICPAMCPF